MARTGRPRRPLTPLPPERVDPACGSGMHAADQLAYIWYGCRCAPARAAYVRYRKFLALRGGASRVPALGTMRRLRALARMGHGFTAVAREQGLATETLRKITLGVTRTVTVRVERQVIDFYDRFWDVDGETRAADPFARRWARTLKERAREAGWPPPMWWDDDRIDCPTARGPNRQESERGRARSA
jgi:hypothetical protein